MNMVLLSVVGILFAILLFGIKTGIGCGFSNRSTKEILAIAGSYFILSIIIGSLIGYVDQSNLDVIAIMGMSLHVLVALLLIGAGSIPRNNGIAGVMFSIGHNHCKESRPGEHENHCQGRTGY